ncbi:uncharacterized protein HD556DRAFT_1239953 [Suillus plorans]|uniref:BZIP domain-containing protein n=1 Tax=Suillus plorans TaxID=116603 RepID=A0A9P7DGR0_9AGAM|nr:uncharacterized protein HD556DRAFT_1239953 [Suillus plorans]KAG1791979.1 hypothetical protein HD556DRAFT_1239953 [Suillus plorans]
MSSMAHSAAESVSSQPDRPERSRNAKAQARHRAKRKAYIEQLEQTVTKLQTALGFTPDQVAALPPPLVKIRELEQENTRLQKENEEMRRLLESDHRAGHLSSDYRRHSMSNFHDTRNCDRDFKKRKMDDLYMVDAPHGDRPPPLTIPQPISHHQYGNIPSHNGTSGHGGVSGNSSSLFNLHAPAFHHLPHTPSGSSSTSSPPFSAMTIVFCFTHQQPTQMQHSSHSPVNSRPSSLSHHPLPSNYHSNHYGSVKVEDDHYSVSCTQSISQPLTDWFLQSSNHHNHNGPSNHYHTTLPPFAQTVPEAEVDNWHAYSAERAQVHR